MEEAWLDVKGWKGASCIKAGRMRQGFCCGITITVLLVFLEVAATVVLAVLAVSAVVPEVATMSAVGVVHGARGAGGAGGASPQCWRTIHANGLRPLDP